MMSSGQADGRGPVPQAVRSRWHPSLLLAGIVAVLVLLGSWLGGHWHAADDAVFGYFNAQLKQGSLTTFWAITNWRPFDTVAAAIMGVFVLAWLRQGGVLQLDKRLAQFIGFCMLLLIAKGIEHLIVDDILHYERQSPSLAHAEAVRLSEIVTWIAVKDRGSTVFPGDHAFVLFAAIGFLWIHAGRAMGAAAALVLLPFAVPRLAVGAHWLSDVAVGGLSMAILLLCAGYATPLGGVLATFVLERAARPLAICIAWGRRLRLLP